MSESIDKILKRSNGVINAYRLYIPAEEREVLPLDDLSTKQKSYLAGFGTMCWVCKHSRDLGCSWFRGLRPVLGWSALYHVSSGVGRSFVVLDCPRYIPDMAVNSRLHVLEDKKNLMYLEHQVQEVKVAPEQSKEVEDFNADHDD